ncbi:hypothetical protein [Geoglobus acetivorans]|uniref:Uncharacterized protein n=1 Tax=Geoglobus acetivorans TaxID=565033 RepID=A0A0A7GEP5_GEOAI|nr:hypothetical protein GACE_1481 [Geoglobus acetivorans]
MMIYPLQKLHKTIFEKLGQVRDALPLSFQDILSSGQAYTGFLKVWAGHDMV